MYDMTYLYNNVQDSATQATSTSAACSARTSGMHPDVYVLQRERERKKDYTQYIYIYV